MKTGLIVFVLLISFVAAGCFHCTSAIKESGTKIENNAASETEVKLEETALEANRMAAQAAYYKGVLQLLKDPQAALQSFKKALELDPDNQDYKKLVEQYSKLLELVEQHSKLLKEDQSTFQSFKEALELDPDNQDCKNLVK